MDGSSPGNTLPERRSAKPVRIEFDTLTRHNRLGRRAAAERQLHSDRTFRVLVGTGRGCTLHGNSMPPMVIVPLRRNVRLSDGESVRMLRPGQLHVAEGGHSLQAVGTGGALWIAFVAPPSVWRQLFDASTERATADPVLLPATHLANRVMRRAVVRAAREAARAASGKFDATTAVIRFATLLAELQSAFDPLVKRCPGRTLAQRRSVFLRLQRVYNRIESTSDLDLGVSAFARVANYSTCHFVRTFNLVYGATPYSLIMERRLKQALHLVHESELSITEVARASGFEDRCAFARSFKRRYGTTATAARSQATGIAV
ncbi:MAG TPA: AraC family transcriptional regulator [Rhodanobacteraceae bacterium]|jgi:AraC family transcriptional regulator|nr:AraC family transcriptional regulator [Rhodanobacteraceae bacterium]